MILTKDMYKHKVYSFVYYLSGKLNVKSRISTSVRFQRSVSGSDSCLIFAGDKPAYYSKSLITPSSCFCSVVAMVSLILLLASVW